MLYPYQNIDQVGFFYKRTSLMIKPLFYSKKNKNTLSVEGFYCFLFLIYGSGTAVCAILLPLAKRETTAGFFLQDLQHQTPLFLGGRLVLALVALTQGEALAHRSISHCRFPAP